MQYLDIVNLIFQILTGILGLLLIHFLLFYFVGLFTRKKYPKTDKRLNYAVVISARNEEKVIGNLIASIKKNKYPQDKLHVFVIAHNCFDATAQIARAAGATVYEYNNPNERMKGYALKYLFDRIKEDYGTDGYDGFLMLDADNILAENYIEKMNDAFVANGRQQVITSFRNSKNFGTNLISAMYGLYFMQGCRFEMRGRTVLGCSTRVSGTGFLIPVEAVKDGWKYVTLTEDWEFSADQIINNRKIIYCDEAVFYDEQPTGVHMMLRQRLRWAKGHWLVCLTRYRDILKAFFKPAKRGGGLYKCSLYDMSLNILPVCTISLLLFAAQLICYALAPLFGYGAAEVWINWAINFGFSAASFLLANFITGLITVIVEGKRIKNARFGVMLGAVLLWPLFILLSIPLDVICLFVKVKWKAIPHVDVTTFEQVNDVATDEYSDGEESREVSDECAAALSDEERDDDYAVDVSEVN